MPCPEGEIHKSVDIKQLVSLHEIDLINSNRSGADSLYSGESTEIDSALRHQIDQRIKDWLKEGKATLKIGVRTYSQHA